MGRSSSKPGIQFWLLLTASLLLAMLVISLFLQVVKAMLYLLLVLILVPFIYALLRNLFQNHNFRTRDTKMKVRD